MHAPRTSHLEAVKHILRFIKSSPGKGIFYGSHGHLNIVGYLDANWAGSPDDRRSTTGYCTFVGGNIVMWKSKKQSVVTKSSVEAKYRAMAKTACELIWLRSLARELGFNVKEPMQMHCDHQAAIYIASNPVFHERTKHIEVDCHFVQEKVTTGLISTPYVRSENQLADMLIKA